MKNLLQTILLVGAMAAGLIGVVTLPARALVEIDVNKGVVEPLPIAITDFVSNGGIGTEISELNITR